MCNNETILFKGKAFNVLEVTRNLNDVEVRREIIDRPHGVVVVAIHDNKVALLKEYCAGSDSFIWSLPGGKVDLGESLETAALRELKEEVGFTAGKITKLRFAYEHPSTSKRISHVFIAQDLYKDPLETLDEIIEVHWFTLEESINIVMEDFVSDVSTIGNLLMVKMFLEDSKSTLL